MSPSDSDLSRVTNDTDPHPEGSPYQLHRATSVDAYFRSEISLAASQTSSLDENELSEEQLRELYDNEEIERFLHLFSAYVTEVQAPETPDGTHPSFCDDDDTSGYHVRASDDNYDWAPLPQSSEGNHPPATYESLAEEVAHRYVLPMLPPSRPSPPFTFSRLRLATERLYLAIIPVYGPFLRRMHNLASWKDPTTSSMYCLAFWVLWWYNLIASAFVTQILFSLLKRRIFPYPSLEDLRRHREEVSQADEFGEQVSARLSSKASDLKEIWRLFKLWDNANKGKFRSSKPKGSSAKENTSTDTFNKETDQTILEDVDDSEEVQDLKRIGLHLLEELADLHERIHNIFIWRRPSSSRFYGMIILAMLIAATFVPTKYIVKIVLFSLGFAFWHVVPVILALPPSERKRLPPPLIDVPTDAEYAMELISQRVAAGLDVTPPRKHKRTDTTESAEVASKHKKGSPSQGSNKSIDWKKWGDRVAIGKSAVNDIKRLKPGKTFAVHEVWPPRHPLVAGMIGIAQPQAISETHTYPGQHGSTPGLLTLTHNALLFTPLMSQTPKVIIPLTAVKGVKKAGLLKGLNVRWNESIAGVKEQKEEKFAWIGSRDELFARLVGSDGRRWMKV